MRRFILAFTAGALALGIVAGPVAAKQPAESPSIVEFAIAANTSGAYAGQFDTLIFALGAADPVVIETLSGKGQFTVFAPTDDAFAKLPADVLAAVVADQELLTDILLYHVAKGERYAADVVASDQIRMLNGDFADVEVNDMGAYIDGAKIIVTDLDTPTNGIIHAVDTVLLP